MNAMKSALAICLVLLAASCSAPSSTSSTPVKKSKSKSAADAKNSKGTKDSDSDSDDTGSDDSDDAESESGDESGMDDAEDMSDTKDGSKPNTGGMSGSKDPSTTPEDLGGTKDPVATCDTKPGKAIKFAEKIKDMIAGDLGGDATFGDKPRTIELWAKFSGPKSWTAEQTILEIGKPGSPDNGNNVFGIDMSGRNGNSGVFGPYTHGVSDNNGTGAPPQYMAAADVGWLHLSWSYDPSKTPANKRFEFTVNGAVLPTEFAQGKWDATGGKMAGNTGFVLLGASQNFGNEGWDGVMDEVRIWGVARSAQEIKDNMNVIVKPNTPGLIAYYQFNEADAANVKDSTGNAAHTLSACKAGGGACPSKNDATPSFIDSDIPGTFRCGS